MNSPRLMAVLLTALVLGGVISPLRIAAQTPNDEAKKGTIVEQMPRNRDDETRRDEQIKAQLAQYGFTEMEASALIGGEIVHPQNSPDDYRISYSKWKTGFTEWTRVNEVPVRFQSGGGFWFTTEGGPLSRLSISFEIPFKKLVASVHVGSEGKGGYFAVAPNRHEYFNLYLRKLYRAQVYIIEKRVWNINAWSYEWVEWSGGRYLEYVGIDSIVARNKPAN